MSLSVSEITENVFHVEAESQYEIASTFMRVQEFYESPYKGIRGHFFTHEQYMDTCAFGNKRSAQDEPVFSYFEDWAGFNVPGNVFRNWLDKFPRKSMWDKELELVNLIDENVEEGNKFYVIGTYDADTINHELSHAWYYLDRKYRKTMGDIADKLSDRAKEQLKKYIIAEGYVAAVVRDETIAYLSTNEMTRTAKMFDKVPVPWKIVYELQKTFEKFKEEKIDEDH